MPWTKDLKKGVYSILSQENKDYVFHIENMDTKRYSHPQYYETLSKLYKVKYTNTKFDLILSSDNNALEFLKKYRDNIFGNVPVSFSGINNYEDSLLDGHSNYTGVSEKISLEKNIELILKIHPHVKNIFFINDYLKTGRMVHQNVTKKHLQYKDKVNIIYNENITIKELKKEIRELKDDTVILIGAYFRDKNDTYITSKIKEDYIFNISSIPVYSAVFTLSNNLIGGYATSSYYQGSLMAQLGKRILQGTSADSIKVITEDTNQYIFNEKGLSKYKINRKLLPYDSKITNDHITYYDQFINMIQLKYLLLIVVILIAVVIMYKKMLFNEKRILKIIVYGPLLFLPLVIGGLIYNVVEYNNKVYKNDIQKLKARYLEERQNRAIEALEKTLLYTRNIGTKMHAELKLKLHQRVEEAHIIANNIYNENKDQKTKKEIQEMIIDSLSKIRFFDGRGYYFINTNKGKGVLVEGVSRLDDFPNLLDLKNLTQDYGIRKQIKIVRNKSEGYVQHKVRRIDIKNSPSFVKLSYIKEFKPFDWHIGTGEYLQPFDEYIRTEIYHYLQNIRYGDNEYFFASTPQGLMIAHGDSPELIGKNMINKVDQNGIYYTKTIIENALTNNFKFTKYGWFNNETKKMDIKYATARYMQEYNMIIGTGVFENDIEKLISQETTKLNLKNNEQIEQIITISLIVLVIVLLLSFLLSNLIKNKFQDYNKKLNDLNKSLEKRIKKEIQVSKEKDNLIYQQAKMASMGEMIGNIAHQWRQPLSIISVGATGLKLQKEHGLLTDNHFNSTCDVINDNAQYLSKTIDDFKNFIKNDRDKVKFNLEENIVSFLSLVHSSIKNHQINIELDLDKDLIINGYPNELTQCFMNIFNNAKDAMRELNTIKYLFISSSVISDQVIITFKDNAGGINKNVIHHIFEPYFTTKHKSQGTGLGLSMTYKIIVDGMEGSIDVKNSEFIHNNEKFNGAEFIIRLPLY